MTFAAISYEVKPGFEDKIAEICSSPGFKGGDSPALVDSRKEGEDRLAGMGAFIAGDLMVRVIQFDGELGAVARQMAAQEGVRKAEQQLAPYLREPRDTITVDGFVSYFERNAMRCIQERVIRDRPAVELAAMRHTIKPDAADAIAQVFAETKPAGKPVLRGGGGQASGAIEAVALFVHEQAMVRVVQYEGELADVARFMAGWGARSNLEARLAPYMDEDRNFETSADFEELWWRHNMRRISMLRRSPQGSTR